MDEFVRATDYDELEDAYERLRLQYEKELHRSYHRLKPRAPQPRVTIRTRVAPLDVGKEDHPL